jgi:competence protein ComEC
MPVVSAFVMPAGILGLIAMPFGLDGVFWRLMELGIGWMIAVSQWVAALPGAIGRVHAFGSGPLALMSLGMIALALLRTPLRLAGAGVLAAGVVWAALTPAQDVFVATNGGSVAVRGEDGRLRAMRTGGDTFALREWLAADADARVPTDRTLTDGVSCDPSRCVTKDVQGRLVMLARQPQALAEGCATAALIVTLRPLPAGCQAMVIDRATLQARGAMTLRMSGQGSDSLYVVEAARPMGVSRPWASAGDDPSVLVPAFNPQTSTPRDATPREADVQPGD